MGDGEKASLRLQQSVVLTGTTFLLVTDGDKPPKLRWTAGSREGSEPVVQTWRPRFAQPVF